MSPLTETEQLELLRIARQALVGYLNVSEIPKVPEPAEALRQHCGAFVSLHNGRNLRGCVGVITANKPLYLTVGECAVWAGLQDHRFPPVTKREVKELNFEISVLSPLTDITPEKIEVGRHGLWFRTKGCAASCCHKWPYNGSGIANNSWKKRVERQDFHRTRGGEEYRYRLSPHRYSTSLTHRVLLTPPRDRQDYSAST